MLEATAHTPEILATARGLLAASIPLIDANGITLLGVSLANLGEGHAIQLALPLGRRSRYGLDAALDEIRERYGSAAVTRAVLLGRDPGIAVPLLPD